MKIAFLLMSVLVRSWTWLYTLGIDSTSRATRREEIASDLWECAQDGRTDTFEIGVRWLRGIPDDLAWRFEHPRSLPASEAMNPRRVVWLHDFARDLRYGLRALGQNPLFATIAVVTIAFGIGANTAIFSVADAVLLRPLPVTNPRDLIVLRQRGPAGDVFPFHTAAVTDLAQGSDVLAGLAAFRPNLATLVSVGGEPELVMSQMVSGNYHEVVGTLAVVGRTLNSDDKDPVAVISHRYWQRRFGGDPSVLGRQITIHGARQLQPRTFTIVGVTNPEFFGTQPGRYVDLTTPLAAQTVNMPPGARWLYLIGRLAPGVSRDQARTALRLRWNQLAVAGLLPSRPTLKLELEVDAGTQGLNELRRDFGLALQILMAAVSVVLLVASANVAGLLVIRSGARQQEMSVRLSLGAGRSRIVRQLLTESALLAGAAGAAGTTFAFWATDLLIAMMARGRNPIALDVSPNLRTLAFAGVITVMTILLFGLLPALGASRAEVFSGLKRSATSTVATRNVLGRAMVAAQIALLVLLLVSAGLFTRTLQKLRGVDAGFRQDQVLLVSLSIGSATPRDRVRTLFEELYGRFSRLPGVQSVSMSMDTPSVGELSMCGAIEVVGRPTDRTDARVCRNVVGPRFFETMGISVLAGRDFAPSDDGRAPRYAVISESVAREYFGDQDPLGRQIVVGVASAISSEPASIIGVVKDVRYTSLRTHAPLMVYRPYLQEGGVQANTFLIRTSSATTEVLAPMLRAEVRAAAPAVPPPSIVSLEDVIAAGLVEERMLAALSSVTAGLAAILAAIGIYSIVAAAVARRRREIGIRMALGALPGQVARMAVREAFSTVLLGLVIGIPTALAAAVAARAVLADVLFDLSPTDPLILLSSAVAIFGIALSAAFVPVRRASRIDPVEVIRSE